MIQYGAVFDQDPRGRGHSFTRRTRRNTLDLAVEVEITSSWIDKTPIYAGLGIPEVWRYDGKTLHVEQLQADGTYARQDQSSAFPFLPLAQIPGFLERRDATDETSWIRSFREWVRGLREDQEG